MSLKAEPEWVGKVVRCPGCNTKLQIPGDPAAEMPAPDAAGPALGAASAPAAASTTHGDYSSTSGGDLSFQQSKPQREGWKEADPANPSIWLSLGIGAVLFVAWYGILYPFNPSPETPSSEYNFMQYLAAMFIQRTWVNFAETFFFTWAMGIVYLKLQKLRHQREALLLDVLPMELGREINSKNIGSFIDHVYNLPHRLRDSLMVNRIRKGLELFEIKQSTSAVGGMMSSQSDIDANRVGGSYALLKVFLWAIPILGFIGTVLGLSQAIGSMDLSDAKDVDKIIGSISQVTSGLGTAFDTTLLGLVLAMILQFPMSSLSKKEDDNLNDIDAFCNDILLPRLEETMGGNQEPAGLADALVQAVAGAQKEFLVDLNELSKRMNEYANNLDKRSDTFQAVVTKEFINNTTLMRSEMQESLKDTLRQTSQYIGGLETGIRGLNTVLKELGEKQVIVQQTVKKKGWFGRD